MPTPMDVSDVATIAYAPTRGFEAPAVSPPYLRASNVLYDSGWEGFVRYTHGYISEERETPTGSHTYTVPYYSTSCGSGSVWPGGECAGFSPWVQRSGPYTVTDAPGDTAWKVSNTDPRSGRWGAVWWRWQASTVPALLAVQGFNHPAGLSARCLSSDTITWGGWIKSSSVAGSPQVVLWLSFFTEAQTLIGSSTQASSLTTSYAEYTMTVGAPSNSYYLRAMFGWSGTGAADTAVYIDDATLGVV